MPNIPFVLFAKGLENQGDGYGENTVSFFWIISLHGC